MCAAAEAREGIIRAGGGAMFRADAKRRCFASWVSESRAVAALRPAGYSSGRGDCARGGCSARRWGSLAGGCLSCAGRAVLSECPAFDHACLCGFLAVSYVRSRLLFAALRQTGRLARRSVPIPAVGRDRRSCVFERRAVIGLRRFTSGLSVSLWRFRRKPRRSPGGDRKASWGEDKP